MGDIIAAAEEILAAARAEAAPREGVLLERLRRASAVNSGFAGQVATRWQASRN
jgi:hypothetical protein